MIPILYKANEKDFEHNGIGPLVDALSCIVTENRNGTYEAEFVYPTNGALYPQITEDCLFKAKPNETSEPQIFRIYKSSKPMNKKVTFYGEHVSYRLKGIPIETVEIKSGNAQTALSNVLAAGIFEHDFTGQSDIETLNSTSLSLVSIRAALGGVEGSLLDVYGGEYEFDNFIVKLHAHRGRETGIRIAYGKNLTDLKQDRSISEVYTAVYPYAKYTPEATDTNPEPTEITVTLPEKVIYSQYADRYAHSRAYIKDFTELFEQGEEITVEKLRAKAQSWAKSSGFDVPTVSITVSFKTLWNSPEYAKYAILERVALCDTLSVYYEDLGVSATAKVIKTVFDVLKERYNSVELGDARSNFADTINQNTAAIDNVKQEIKTQATAANVKLAAAIAKATAAITGQSGGYVVLNPSQNPQEILIMDTPNTNTAVNVWRWNSAGLGHSSKGYNGPFTTAITADGKIVADFITAGQLNGSIIKASTIQADAISADTFRIIFNKVSDYILFEDGQLKIINASATESAVLGKNGLEIFNGDITVYTGANRSSKKAIYLDSDGNAAFAGYITQPGSTTKAIVGSNAYNNPGFFIYQFESDYKKSDGTYKPYMEFWRSANDYSVITGVNQLRLTVDKMDDTSFTALSCTPTGGSLNGIWGISTYNLRTGTTIRVDNTDVGAVWWDSDKYVCTNVISGFGWGISIGNSYRIIANSTGGILYGAWDFGQEQTFSNAIGTKGQFVLYDGSTKTGSLYSSTNLNTCLKSENGKNLLLVVGNNTRLSCSSAGGTLYGAWDFGQDQFFSHNIGSSLGFVLQSGSSGTRYGSFYVSSSKQPCFNSDTDADFNFCVGGYTKMKCTSAGGNLYGTWYGTSSQAIPSDRKVKHDIESLPETYSKLFDNLNPVRYKYNDGESDRFHTGFIAQDVEEAIKKSGLDSKDFAGYIVDPEGNYYLRYEEFVALAVNEVKILKQKNIDLEKRVADLESKIEAILNQTEE